MRARARACAFIAPLLLLAACGRQELFAKLDERAANDVVAELQLAGITARKDGVGKDGWSVSVSQGDFATAVTVLNEAGLPRRDYDTLGSVFAKSGYGTTPFEERNRYIHARQQELRALIEQIDGVTAARVQLALPPPTNSLSTTPATPPSASVVVRYRPGVDVREKLGEIQLLVANATDGLDVRRVAVQFYPARDTARAAPTREGDGDGTLMLLLPLGVGLLGLAGWQAVRQRRGRKPGALTPVARSAPATERS